MIQPRTPPGVLELLPHEQLAFQRMLDTIRRGFERFGFLPIETPVYELTDVLLTKTGGETERQVYFVQSTGALQHAHAPELALHFDLTVPLARYVAEHEQQLNFPFRRYQIQRVYRGERATHGRYREFYQCDIDVIDRDTLPLAYDAECAAVIYGIFAELGFGDFTIYINNRKALRVLLERRGVPVARHADVMHEIDRLGKQPRAAVVELVAAITGADTARAIVEDLVDTPLAKHAPAPELDELQQVYDRTRALGVPDRAVKIDLSIARGLDYYTGTVYETFLDGYRELGSICSGGRYDNLAEHYTKSKLPGVGISIGATRLFAQLLERKLIDVTRKTTAQVLVLHVEAALAAGCAELAAELRAAGVAVEVYASPDKLGKQFKYADRAGVPAAILYGSRERDAGIVKVKTIADKQEHDVPRGELVARVKALLA